MASELAKLLGKLPRIQWDSDRPVAPSNEFGLVAARGAVAGRGSARRAGPPKKGKGKSSTASKRTPGRERLDRILGKGAVAGGSVGVPGKSNSRAKAPSRHGDLIPGAGPYKLPNTTNGNATEGAPPPAYDPNRPARGTLGRPAITPYKRTPDYEKTLKEFEELLKQLPNGELPYTREQWIEKTNKRMNEREARHGDDPERTKRMTWEERLDREEWRKKHNWQDDPDNPDPLLREGGGGWYDDPDRQPKGPEDVGWGLIGQILGSKPNIEWPGGREQPQPQPPEIDLSGASAGAKAGKRKSPYNRTKDYPMWEDVWDNEVATKGGPEYRKAIERAIEIGEKHYKDDPERTAKMTWQERLDRHEYRYDKATEGGYDWWKHPEHQPRGKKDVGWSLQALSGSQLGNEAASMPGQWPWDSGDQQVAPDSPYKRSPDYEKNVAEFVRKMGENPTGKRIVRPRFSYGDDVSGLKHMRNRASVEDSQGANQNAIRAEIQNDETNFKDDANRTDRMSWEERYDRYKWRQSQGYDLGQANYAKQWKDTMEGTPWWYPPGMSNTRPPVEHPQPVGPNDVGAMLGLGSTRRREVTPRTGNSSGGGGGHKAKAREFLAKAPRKAKGGGSGTMRAV